MKHIDEYRDRQLVERLTRSIREEVTSGHTLMEICGGQTHTIMRYSLQELLPGEITLIHGPGCPVCVTPAEKIDAAVTLSADPRVILTSFGDMLRVPGSRDDLLSARARGGDVRMVYSPLEALEIAEENPRREIVFFAVGFETTAPAVALAIRQARNRGVKNFSVLVSHVRVPPAMEFLLSSSTSLVEGFLAAGHVCAVMGTGEYLPIAEKYRVPIVVTGFEPVDILLGIRETVRMLEQGRHGVVNAYSRAVRSEGNPAAKQLLGEVFEEADCRWRGIGWIPSGGLTLTETYRAFDAMNRFGLQPDHTDETGVCMAGEILTGRKLPTDCPAFSVRCSPDKPLGAPMVSSEGACAAYFRYGSPRHDHRAV